ncbi:MAG TPA: tetratricopeptide repeat protein [Terriglobales bacterium]|jgi:Flp pilus assembly protein TadD|nr:tetratricopeptide repeat protein [Terriglobales bacterium]
MATQETGNITADRLLAGEPLGQILDIPETKIQALAALGYNQYQQGKLDDAKTLFDGVTALDPKSYLGYAGLGAIALAKQTPDLESAFTNLSKAAELNPNDATVQANLGETLLRQGKVDVAKSHLEKAFALDPGHNDPGANRARAIVGGLSMIVKEVETRLRAQDGSSSKAN